MTDPADAAIAAAELLVRDTNTDPGPALTPLLDAATARFRRESTQIDADRICYLATLVHQLGLRAQARELLEVSIRASSLTVGDAVARSLLGAMAAGMGDHRMAVGAFLDALIDDHAASGELGYVISTNLAATYWRSGQVADAAHWANRARARQPATREPLADVLLAGVEAAISALDPGVRPSAVATSRHRIAVARAIQTLDNNDPRSLIMLADLAATEFDRALSAGDSDRAHTALAVLENLSQLIGVTLGDEHPQFAIVFANRALAEFELACAVASVAEARQATALIQESVDLLTRALSPTHPDVVAASGSLAAAQFELARLEQLFGEMRDAAGELTAVYQRAARTLGISHPHTLIILSNLATAELELARIDPTAGRAHHAAATLDMAIQRMTPVLGAEHPTLRLASQQRRVCDALLRRSQESSATAEATGFNRPREMEGSSLNREYRPVEASTPSAERHTQAAISLTHDHDASSITCREALADVYLYLELEVGDERRQTIREHLDECSPCLREFGIEQEVQALVARVAGSELAPGDLKARLRRRLAELVFEARAYDHSDD